MAANPTSSPDRSITKPAKAFSCVRCFERKVKCNNENPCSACMRSKVDCVLRVPAPARRRKRRTPEEVLQARLSRYENLLKSHGLDPDDSAIPEDESSIHEASVEPDRLQPTAQVPIPGSERSSDTGRLYLDRGKSTFLESSLWTSLSNEISEPRDVMPESDDEEGNEVPAVDPFRVDLVLGYTPVTPPTFTLHPEYNDIFKLWQIFLENINPLTKIIHQPTVQAALVEATINIRQVKRNFEPLMFAIYSTAVTSLTDAQCQNTFGEYRVTLLAKYSLGMRQTLMRSRFLGTSEMTVLQAFVLYLFAMRPFYRARTVWVLAGVASRIAQGMGLHRDGTELGLPVFETEMRRRLWWQLAILEGRSAELTGSAYRPNYSMGWTTKIPLNVNDAELFPHMKEPPVEHTKPTEMISCLLRYTVADFRKQKWLVSGKEWNAPFYTFGNGSRDHAEADKLIDEFEKLVEEKFLRYLDPSIPVHFHTSIIGRASINVMRMMAHHPLGQNDEQKDPSKLNPAERELLLLTSLKVIECDNLAHSTKSTQRFLWHVHVHFQWHAFIYLLSDLRAFPDGELAERVWQQVEEVFEHHPDFISEFRRALYIAVGNLTLKAWSAREKALAKQNLGFVSSQPEFIALLHRQRMNAKACTGLWSNYESVLSTDSPSVGSGVMPTLDPHATQKEQMRAQEPEAGIDYEGQFLMNTPLSGSEPMDWSQWDSLLQELDIPR